jgi:hypothetical protein
LKLNESEKIILLYLGVMSVMLSVGNTSTRYFLPFIPLLYIVSISLGIKMYFFVVLYLLRRKRR